MVGVADRRFGAGDEGDERQIPDNQMIDQPADIDPVADSRQAPLICPNATNDALHPGDRGIQIG